MSIEYRGWDQYISRDEYEARLGALTETLRPEACGLEVPMNEERINELIGEIADLAVGPRTEEADEQFREDVWKNILALMGDYGES